jgi:hypothetical protein
LQGSTNRCAAIRSCSNAFKESQILRELRRLDLLEKYGPSAETLSDEQLELLELKPGVSTSEVEAETQRAQLSLPLKAASATPWSSLLTAWLLA